MSAPTAKICSHIGYVLVDGGWENLRLSPSTDAARARAHTHTHKDQHAHTTTHSSPIGYTINATNHWKLPRSVPRAPHVFKRKSHYLINYLRHADSVKSCRHFNLQIELPRTNSVQFSPSILTKDITFINSLTMNFDKMTTTKKVTKQLFCIKSSASIDASHLSVSRLRFTKWIRRSTRNATFSKTSESL